MRVHLRINVGHYLAQVANAGWSNGFRTRSAIKGAYQLQREI